jgi:hypothetical protein
MKLIKVGTKKITLTFFLCFSIPLLFTLFLAGSGVGDVRAQSQKYPPLSEYMMAPEEEVALARSAAPDNISSRSTVKILTTTGYKIAAEGNNGFVCLVIRGWAGPPVYTPERDRLGAYDPKLRFPMCLDPIASKTVLPLHEFRTKLGMEGKDPDAIGREVSIAYSVGKLPKMEGVAFGYMWSAGQYFGPGVGAGPHMMIYAPYYKNSMLGGNEPGLTPFVLQDEGTPFTVVVVPVDGNEAVKPKPTGKRSQNIKQNTKSTESANSSSGTAGHHHR